jgi:hypothetical protein
MGNSGNSGMESPSFKVPAPSTNSYGANNRRSTTGLAVPRSKAQGA